MVTIHPLSHQHVSVKMEALVVVGTQTHAPVHLGTQEHFAPLAPLHALLVISSTTVPAVAVCVCACVYVCVCACVCMCVCICVCCLCVCVCVFVHACLCACGVCVCVCLVMLSYKKH